MFSFQNWLSFPATPVAPPPPVEGVISRSIEIDFGSVPVEELNFVVIDPEITGSSRITGNVAYSAPAGKSLDEIEVDDIVLRFGAGAGQFTIFARSLQGAVSGKFVVHYFISEN